MFLDTITALQSANDYGRNALEVLNQKVGLYRLLRMKPEVESMVENIEASPLALAAEQYATVNKYAGAFLRARAQSLPPGRAMPSAPAAAGLFCARRIASAVSVSASGKPARRASGRAR